MTTGQSPFSAARRKSLLDSSRRLRRRSAALIPSCPRLSIPLSKICWPRIGISVIAAPRSFSPASKPFRPRARPPQPAQRRSRFLRLPRHPPRSPATEAARSRPRTRMIAIAALLALVFAGAIFRSAATWANPILQAVCFIHLGVGYLTNGDIEKAETANRKALELQPDDSVALENGVGLSGILNHVAEGEKYIAEAKRIGLNGTGLLGVELQFQYPGRLGQREQNPGRDRWSRASANSGTHAFVLPGWTAPVVI